MNALAILAVFIAILVYIELAVGFGYYMFILTSRETTEADEAQKRQIKKYSIIAGVAFPITFAIIIANKVAEKR